MENAQNCTAGVCVHQGIEYQFAHIAHSRNRLKQIVMFGKGLGPIFPQ